MASRMERGARRRLEATWFPRKPKMRVFDAWTTDADGHPVAIYNARRFPTADEHAADEAAHAATLEMEPPHGT